MTNETRPSPRFATDGSPDRPPQPVLEGPVLLLTPVANHTQHALAKRIYDYLLNPVRFDLYLYQPLQRLCDRVILYDYLDRMLTIGATRLNEELIDLVRKERPPYILWNSMYWYGIRESTFQQIRAEGTKIIGWFLDDEVGFDNYSQWWLPYVDFFVTNFEDAVPRYRQLGAPAAHALAGGMTGMPVSSDGRWQEIRPAYDVTFVGRQYLDRQQHIQALRDRQIDVRVFGREWPGGHHVPYESMVDIFESSRINLSFSKVARGQRQMKGRIFEICTAGGFVLTEYTPEIERYFEVGKELVCFDTAEELVAKATYYLSHDDERRTIARAGWQKATSKYTSLHIMADVLREARQALDKQSAPPVTSHRPTKTASYMRKEFSKYHLRWSTAMLQECDHDLWKQALSLALSYNPLNFKAWACRLFLILPSSARTPLIQFFRVLRNVRRRLVSAATMPGR